jgi:AcrR family transcriptional regulator
MKEANKVETRNFENPALRERVLDAAFAAFAAHGYEGASTLEIASRANVSKRELYSLFQNKQGLLAACIAERSKKMRLPLELAAAKDRDGLAVTLEALATTLLRGFADPAVQAVYRLAIAEAERTPAIAETVHAFGRGATKAALTEFLATAQGAGLIGPGEPSTMAGRFLALVLGDLLVQLLMGVASPLSETEIRNRARAATEAFLVLYPDPKRRQR